MRLTNGFGALAGLFLAIGLDWALITPVYNFIDTGFTGDARVLALIGMAVVFTLITIGIPVLMGVEDTTQSI